MLVVFFHKKRAVRYWGFAGGWVAAAVAIFLGYDLALALFRYGEVGLPLEERGVGESHILQVQGFD